MNSITVSRIAAFIIALGFAGRAAIAEQHAVADHLADALPSGAFAYAESHDLGSLIGVLRKSRMIESVLKSSLFKEAQSSEPFAKGLAGKALAEHVLQMNLWDAGEKLLGGKIGLAFYPGKDAENPNVVLLIRPTDKEVWATQRDWIDPLLDLVAKPAASENGVRAYRMTGKGDQPVEFALHKDWLIVATEAELLERTIALQRGDADKQASIAKSAFFQKIAPMLDGKDSLARACIDLERLPKAIGTGKRFGFPHKMNQPLASLLFGGILELGMRSSAALITLEANDEGFLLETRLDATPKALEEHHQVFFCHHPETGIKPLPQVPNMIGGFTWHRELGEWYRTRDHLLEDHVLPEFDKFESGIGNILPGRDFGEDVMPLLGNNITFVSAVQDFEHLDGELGVKLPAFAFVIDLAEPEEGEAVFQLFVQTLLSVLNLEAGKQKRQPWLIDTKEHQGVKITTARYLQKPKGNDLPIVFNFLPAAARVGDQYVVSSSLQLCRQLIDALGQSTDAARLNQNFGFRLDVDPLVDVLKANEAHLQTKRVVEGRSVKQATSDIDLLLTLLGSLKEVTATTSATDDGFALRLEGEFD